MEQRDVKSVPVWLSEGHDTSDIVRTGHPCFLWSLLNLLYYVLVILTFCLLGWYAVNHAMMSSNEKHA